MSRALRRAAAIIGSTGALYAGVSTYTAPPSPTQADRVALAHGGLEVVPPRTTQLHRLRASAAEIPSAPQASPEPFDVLVIGGGATGGAVALDATLRDLSVALVERDDFAAGTSSRSTKLIHGGVRYLEKAFFNLDPGQFKLVFEALSERAVMLHQAPHLAQPFPTLLPCYKIWELPFYWLGLKVYDLVAALGHGLLHLSKFVSASEALRLFPTLSKSSDGQRLRGGIMYYDGQMDDARFNVSVALTAALYGAAVANHTAVESLLFEEVADDNDSVPQKEGDTRSGDEESDGEEKMGKPKVKRRVVGARCRDTLTGDTWDVRARVVVNATGPFTDSVRRMEDENAEAIIAPSAGVHITLPSYYSAQGMGLIVPKTKDGRVVFMLPWLGETIAGTTDSSTDITALPRPHADEVAFILDALSDYLRIDVRSGDVQSAWSGIRPLAVLPGEAVGKGGTESVVRDHVVNVSDAGMVTVTGGKWTTQRVMGEEAVDVAIDVAGLGQKATRCKTRFVRLVGAHTWDESYFTFLAQRYVTGGGWAVSGDMGRKGHSSTVDDRKHVSASRNNGMPRGQLDVECAMHLSRAYGDQAYRIAEIAEDGRGQRLVEGYPIIEAEIVYCMEHEYCETAADFLARRSRLVFLNGKAALAALPRVVEVMAEAGGWDAERVDQELKGGREMIASFSCGIPQGGAD